MFKFFEEKVAGSREDKKEQEVPSFELAQLSPGSGFENLESNKMGNNDLALLMINMLGFRVASFEDITADEIRGTDFENAVITGGWGKDVPLGDFLNQKGVYPNHTIMFGKNIVVSPNYGEVLEKVYENITKTTEANPFDSIGNIFSKVKSDSEGSSADTFLFSNSATGIRYSFPKRFAEGFYHLAKHIEVLNHNNVVDDMFRTPEKAPSPKLYKDVPQDRHSVSGYLSDFVRNQK